MHNLKEEMMAIGEILKEGNQMTLHDAQETLYMAG